MGFVEGIGGKIHHLIEDPVGYLSGNPVAHRPRHLYLAILHDAVYKIGPFLLHDLRLLLGHGPAHQVAPPPGIPGKVPDDLHDLLLVHHASVGLFQDGPQPLIRVGYAFRVVFPANVPGDLLHGAGPEESDAGDDVLKAVGLELGQELAHTGGFQLEYPVRIRCGNHFVYLWVPVIQLG